MDDSRATLKAHDPALVEALDEGGEEEIAVIARISDADVLPAGTRVVTRFGDVATLRVQREKLTELAESSGISSLEAPRRLRKQWDDDELDDELVEAETDEEPPVHASTRRPEGVRATGRGVVVAALDWGCDFAHPAFRRADGKTRLLALWDQSADAPRDPSNRWGYGKIHRAEAINRALEKPDPYGALDYHPAKAGGKGGAHGTHVLDIAAGSGRGGNAPGVAPEADLVFVHLARTTNVLGRGNLGDSASVLEGLDFVFSIAGERPVGVNMSIGAHGGPHDGTTLVELGIDRCVSLAPGRAVVNSGGNYFSGRVHAEGRLRKGEKRAISLEVPKGDKTPSEIELWYSSFDRFTVAVCDPAGTILATVAPGEDRPLLRGGKDIGHAYHVARASNGDHHVDIIMDAGAPDGTWEIRITADSVRDGRYNAWIERDSGLRPKFHADHTVRSCTTGTLCNGRLSITVGAYDARDDKGNLGSFSSAGPTRDGRVKPELVAPGVKIRAARSTPDGEKPGARTTVKSGTSMAAPHVTGTTALVFEAVGVPLEISDTRAILFASAHREGVEGRSGVDVHRFGNGYLDIVAAEHLARTWFEPGAGKPRDSVETEAVVEAVPEAAVIEEAVVETVVEDGSTEESLVEAPAETTTEEPTFFEETPAFDAWVRTDPEPVTIVVVRSRERVVEPVLPGDLLVREAGYLGIRHSSVAVSGRLETPMALRRRGIPVEASGAGAYLEVLETPFGGGADRSVGRRLTDANGLMLRGQSLERSNYS